MLAYTCLAFATASALASAMRSTIEANITASAPAKSESLQPNQYILGWYDPFGTEVMQKYLKRGWQFVVPALCREKGLWFKVNEQMESSSARHCLKVTCHLSGAVSAEFMSRCVWTYCQADLDCGKDGNLLTYGDANVLVDGNNIHTAPRNGAPNKNNILMNSATFKKHDGGLEFRMSDWYSNLPRAVSWYAGGSNCRDQLAQWKEYGIVPRNEESLARCKFKRGQKVSACQAQWNSKIGTQTAWMWKELGPPSDMNGARKVFPGCTTWCDKASCYQNEVPVSEERSKDAFMKMFNSWKRTCEIELDAYAKKRVAKCNNVDGFCLASWEELLPCAEMYPLPNVKK
mmetsp:Transcript_115185/g.229438  ORF Transcript_115185/g.229438 Transcript_115185/m.229438 type:complete len:345 (+) Transcript_115185:57-1091(+)